MTALDKIKNIFHTLATYCIYAYIIAKATTSTPLHPPPAFTVLAGRHLCPSWLKNVCSQSLPGTHVYFLPPTLPPLPSTQHADHHICWSLARWWSAPPQSARGIHIHFPFPSPLQQTQISMPLGAWHGVISITAECKTPMSTSLSPHPSPKHRSPCLLELDKGVISITAECKRHPPPLPSPPPPPNTDLHASWSLAWGDQHHCRVQETPTSTPPPPPQTQISMPLGAWHGVISITAECKRHPPPLHLPPPPPSPKHRSPCLLELGMGWSASLQSARDTTTSTSWHPFPQTQMLLGAS